MIDHDLIIKVGNKKDYLLIVNDDVDFFNPCFGEYMFIEFDQLIDYFSIGASSGKVNILDCKQLHLRLIDYEEMQKEERLILNYKNSEIHSLADAETFDWLVTNGIDINVCSDLLSTWAKHHKK